MHPDDREYVLQRRAELLDEEGPGDIEYRVVWWDGSIHWILAAPRSCGTSWAKSSAYMERTWISPSASAAEEALREREKLLQLVLATLPVGVVVTDPADNIIVANPASKRIWGDVIISGSERRERSIGFWHELGQEDCPRGMGLTASVVKGADQFE